MVLLPFLLALVLPISPPVTITSSFGEYRSTHLHGGIDFSTGGKTGRPVYAVQKGIIRSVKITWRGYGRVIYLEHPDEWMSVYAHLDRFSPPIQKQVDRELKKQGPFPGRLDLPSPVRVKKGELIGYSGETGEGFPHLHFELRHNNDPVNPVSRFPVRNNGKTVLSTIHFSPAHPDSLINGQPFPQSFSFPLKNTVRITGPVTLSVTGHRSIYGSRWGLSNLTLQVDRKSVSSYSLSSFSYDWFKATGFIFQLSESGFSPTRFTYWLTPPPGNPVPVFSGPSRLELSEGDHTLNVTSGNTSRTFTVRREPRTKKNNNSLTGMDFLALPTHMVLEGRGREYPSPPKTLVREPLAVGGRVKRGVPVRMNPFSVSHQEKQPLPLVLQISSTIPEVNSPMLSPVVRVLPRDAALTRPLKIIFRGNASHDRKKSSFYAWKKTWRPLGGTWRGNLLQTRLSTPTTVCVLLDDRPPVIESITTRKDTITVKVRDELSDLPWDGVTVTSGSQTSTLIYDPDRDRATGPFPGRPFTVTARDNAGNTTQTTRK